MFSRCLSVYLLLTWGILIATAPSAEAQLFNWVGGSSTPTANAPQKPISIFSRWNPFGFSSNRLQRSYQEGEYEDRGGYRTFCVRLCDGYYFPLSYRTTRSKMYRESKICEASCDCEARLYYLPSASSDIAHMTDLSGLSYKSLDTAFRYRSQWDEECSCRPTPWSVAEVSRHQEYAALVEEHETIANPRALSNVAGAVQRKERERPTPEPETVVDAAKAVPVIPADTVAIVTAAQTVSVAILNEASSNESNNISASHSLTPGFLASATPADPRPVATTEVLADTKSNSGKAQRRFARLQPRPKKQASRGFFQF
jgi:hypothetical protein